LVGANLVFVPSRKRANTLKKRANTLKEKGEYEIRPYGRLSTPIKSSHFLMVYFLQFSSPERRKKLGKSGIYALLNRGREYRDDSCGR